MVFGMANGFFLLPVILSYVGPVDESEHNKVLSINEKAVEK